MQRPWIERADKDTTAWQPPSEKMTGSAIALEGFGGPGWEGRRIALEDELAADLEDPGWTRGSNESQLPGIPGVVHRRSATAEASVRIRVELRMIEGVEGFKAKLEPGVLGDVGVLVEAEDEVFNAWRGGNVARRGPKRLQVWGAAKSSRIRGKVSAVVGPLQLLGIADLIATVDAKASPDIQESAHSRRERRNRSTEWTWESPAGR